MKAKYLVLGLILLVGFGLRTWGLRWGLPGESRYYHGSSFHPDEQSVFYALKQLSWEKKQFYPTEQNILVKGTLQTYLVGFALAVASPFITISRDPALYRENPRYLGRLYEVGRWLSVIQSMAAILMIYLIAAWLWSPSAGLVAASILSVSPVHVVNAHYISSDSALMLYLLIFFWLCLRIQRQTDLKNYLWAGFLCGLMVANKYNTAPAALMILMAHATATSPRPHGWLLWTGLLAIVGICLGCPAIFLDPKMFFSELHRSLGVNTISHGAFGDGGFPASAFQFYGLEAWIFGLGWGLILFAIGALLFFFKNPERPLMLWWPWVIVYVILLATTSWRLIRWLIPLTPFLYLLMAYLWTHFNQSSVKRISIRAFGIICLCWTFLQSALTVHALGTPDTRDVASSWIEAHWPPGSTVGFTVQPYVWDPTLFQRAYFEKEKSTYLLHPLFKRRDALDKIKPTYLSINDFETGIYQRNPYRYDNLPEAQIFKAIFEDYAKEAEFRKRITLGPWDWFGEKTRYPHDWNYPFTTITLMKRKQA